jgi:tmRNA-binding protein
MTLVPLKLYFNEKGRAKIESRARAPARSSYDKRQTEKKRSCERASAAQAPARQG